MPQDRRTLNALAALLPAGTLGLSAGLATAGANAAMTSGPEAKAPGAVHEQLDTIRKAVSGIVNETPVKGEDGRTEPFLKVDPEKRLAWWGNGWHNGGWGNGLLNWGNGGWGNGGWGNGWHNWGNGWHNGWRNW